MQLESLEIENYKSIEHLKFDIIKINKSYSYSLIGVNESGKSSFLKGLSLLDEKDLKFPEDYNDDSKPVSMQMIYNITDYYIEDLKKELASVHKFTRDVLELISISKIEIKVEYNTNAECTRLINEVIHFKKNDIVEYKIVNKILTKKTKDDTDENYLILSDFFKMYYPNYFYDQSHRVVFWQSTPEYLLLDEIDLEIFSNEPKKISIPLLNCFTLSGIEPAKIKEEIRKLKSAVAINSLQSKLSDHITHYINTVWPEHPISISFQINNNKISLLIEDNGVKWKPKTTSQRSDGFKQFISFLLTISVENQNKKLTNTILLIDEPETHLHPPAQINLLKELIKIASENNNICFYATHSNYLIDKEDLDRNFKVFKEKNQKTSVTQILKKLSTYSEVNFEVFDIITTDYHNELYGYLEFENKIILKDLQKSKKWIDSRNNNEKEVSLSEYIRHSIHHPENKLNKKFTDKELADSIKMLREIKNTLIQKVV